MDNKNKDTSVIVLDENEKNDSSTTSVYDLCDAFERDARRYNRAFFEEQEVCAR